MSKEYKHIPVMLKEVIEYLKPLPGENYIDCTLGGGGYTEAISRLVGESGEVLAIDLDELAINNFKLKISNLKIANVILVQDNFKNLSQIAKTNFGELQFDGIVLDLGLSSAQLGDPSRGFSFNLVDSPLGMNFGEVELKAEAIINEWDEQDLTKIFKNYGEERFAYKIAQAIARERKTARIKTAGQLASLIAAVVPKRFSARQGIHPATKVFQALRITVNQELENLQSVLPQALELLQVGGRLAVISYHSLEDRIVKQYFKQESIDCVCPPELPICRCDHRARVKILTRKVLRPTEEEVLKNPRARSAKLRVAEKI